MRRHPDEETGSGHHLEYALGVGSEQRRIVIVHAELHDDDVGERRPERLGRRDAAGGAPADHPVDREGPPGEAGRDALRGAVEDRVPDQGRRWMVGDLGRIRKGEPPLDHAPCLDDEGPRVGWNRVEPAESGDADGLGVGRKSSERDGIPTADEAPGMALEIEDRHRVEGWVAPVDQSRRRRDARPVRESERLDLDRRRGGKGRHVATSRGERRCRLRSDRRRRQGGRRGAGGRVVIARRGEQDHTGEERERSRGATRRGAESSGVRGSHAPPGIVAPCGGRATRSAAPRRIRA